MMTALIIISVIGALAACAAAVLSLLAVAACADTYNQMKSFHASYISNMSKMDDRLVGLSVDHTGFKRMNKNMVERDRVIRTKLTSVENRLTPKVKQVMKTSAQLAKAGVSITKPATVSKKK